MTLTDHVTFGTGEQVWLRQAGPATSVRNPRLTFAARIAVQFFETLYAGQTGVLELRTFEHKDAQHLRKFLAVEDGHFDPEPIEQFLAETKARKLGAFYGVALRTQSSVKTRKGDGAHCQTLTALFVDADFKHLGEATTRKRIAEFPLPPSIRVNSGGGLHPYWLRDQPFALQVASEAQQARVLLRGVAHMVADVVDESVSELVRVLRIPGSINFKYVPPRPVAVEDCSGKRYTDDDFKPFIDQAPPSSGRFSIPDEIKQGDRHGVLFKLHRGNKARGGSLDASLAMCHVENLKRCHPPIKDDVLDSYLRRSWQQDDRPDYAPKEPRIVVVENLPAFLERMNNVPEPDWLIPGLIPDAGTTLWHGQPRDFKTMFAIATGVALARGGTAFASERFRVLRIVKVAYFSEEDLEPIVAARLRWLTRKAGVPEGFYPFVRKSLSFDVEDDQEFILECIWKCAAEVVIFDPVRSYTGLSDKGPADLRPVTVFLRRIQNETSAKTISLVHHDTKPPTVAKENDARGRSQQASGGGIFSISDCPVSFKKLDWNRVAIIPEDYKVSGDPKPFEVTFETEVWHDDTGAPRFGPREAPWVRPVAVTKGKHEMVDGRLRAKILEFLESTTDWKTAPEIEQGAHIGKDKAPPVLKVLLAERLVERVAGEGAKALGRRASAILWRACGEMLLCKVDL